MIAKIQIEGFNTDRKFVHFNVEVCVDHITHINRPLRSREKEYYMKSTGSLGLKLAEALLVLDGITEVFLQTYRMTVVKGPLFDWQELEPKIVQVIKGILINEFGEAVIIPHGCPSGVHEQSEPSKASPGSKRTSMAK